VLAYARLSGQRADLMLARSAIKCVAAKPAPASPKPERVIEAVCSYYDVPRQALRSQGRSKRVTTARHVAMYLLRQDACQPLTQIGRLFGDRDHSTVLHACRKIERESTAIPQTTADLTAIRGNIASSTG
jgi:chromosomal replication initiator protein